MPMKHIIRLGFSCICYFVLLGASSYALAGEIEDTKDVSCRVDHIRAPEYFPFIGRAWAHEYQLNITSNCDKNEYQAILGIGADCIGQNVCTHSVFSKFLLSHNIIAVFDRVISAQAKEGVFINETVPAYYIPSVCYSYCTRAALIWLDDTAVYMFESVQRTSEEETVRELIRAANIYLNNGR